MKNIELIFRPATFLDQGLINVWEMWRKTFDSSAFDLTILVPRDECFFVSSNGFHSINVGRAFPWEAQVDRLLSKQTSVMMHQQPEFGLIWLTELKIKHDKTFYDMVSIKLMVVTKRFIWVLSHVDPIWQFLADGFSASGQGMSPWVWKMLPAKASGQSKVGGFGEPCDDWNCSHQIKMINWKL